MLNIDFVGFCSHFCIYDNNFGLVCSIYTTNILVWSFTKGLHDDQPVPIRLCVCPFLKYLGDCSLVISYFGPQTFGRKGLTLKILPNTYAKPNAREKSGTGCIIRTFSRFCHFFDIFCVFIHYVSSGAVV